MPFVVNWKKYQKIYWFHLEKLKLPSIKVKDGVYVIWATDLNQAVRVGQGNIKNRLACHRRNKKIRKYMDKDLIVTWTSIPSRYLDGVENYIAQEYKPLIGERFPKAEPIEVELPF